MMYKAFAAITLVAAPIIVLVTQSLLPQQPVRPGAATVQPVATPVVQSAAQPMPIVTAPPSGPAQEPAPFGQPLPDAGQPFLAPGNGLPGGETAPPPPVEIESNDGSVPSISDR